MDNPDLIELLETELNIIIEKARHAGIAYDMILWVLLNRCVELTMQSKTEDLIK